jgi:hypothetical protein
MKKECRHARHNTTDKLFCFLTKGFQQQKDSNYSRNFNNSMNTKTTGTQTTEWTVETPGIEGMSTTARPQQQNPTQQH